MRGRSRRKKRTGKMVSLQKRFLAFMLAFAMIFTNVGTDLHVSFAASGNRVDFTIGGSDLVDAIRQAIEDENVVSQDSLDFTDGATEKFEALFFGDGKVYEVYPDIQGDSMEAELRVFVKLPADADDTYMVTGEEEVYFLYVNNGEDTISCSTTVTRTENGKEKEKTTKRITIKSYEDKFGDEERNIISKPAETAPAEKPSEAVNEETTGNVVNPTDAEKETTVAEETAEVPETKEDVEESKEQPEETKEEETEAATEAPEEITEPETEAPAETEAAEPETEASEPEAEAPAEEPAQEGEVTASISRHGVPLVAMKEDAENAADGAEPTEPEKEEAAEAAEPVKEEKAEELKKEEASEPETAPEPETETTVEETTTEETTAEKTTAEAEKESRPEGSAAEETTAEAETEPEVPAGPGETTVPEGTPESTEPETEPAQPAETTEAIPETLPAPQPEAPAKTADDGDLVGIGYCSTAKVYKSTLNALRVFDAEIVLSAEVAGAEGVTVKLTALSDVLPENGYIEANAVEDEAQLELMKAAADDILKAENRRVTDLFAADITLYNEDGEAVQPDGSVKVTFEGTAIGNSGTRVLYMGEKASDTETYDAQMIKSVAADGDATAFMTDHFSLYVTADTEEIICYEVNFYYKDAEGKDVLISGPQYVEDGKAAEAPAVPDRDGYRFTGWDTDFSKVTGDMKVYAGYAPIAGQVRLTVNYVYSNGSLAAQPWVSHVESGVPCNLTAESPAIQGFTPDQTSVSFNDAYTTDKTVTVTYKGAKVNYTVNHYLLNVDDTKPDTPADTETVPGETGLTTEAKAKEYAGFTPRAISQGTVNADGSTVVEILYERNYYTLTWNTGENASYIAPEQVRYGAAVTKPDKNPTKVGYEFKGWENLQETMPAEDLVVTAKWEAAKRADYKIIYWTETVKEGVYTVNHVINGNGTVGSSIPNGSYKVPEGYKTTPVAEKTDGDVKITADGTAVKNVYFARATYTITFMRWNSRKWKWKEDESLRITARYGVDVSAQWEEACAKDGWGPSKNGYTQYTLLANMPAENLTMYEKDAGSGKKIIYYVEGLDGERTTYRTFEASSNVHLTKEDQMPITGFTYSDWKQYNEWYEEPVLWLYYTRNSYNLRFENCQPMDPESIKFEAKLSTGKPSRDPGRPSYVDSDYTFAGWYLDPGFKEPVNWNETMTEDGLTIYAKWEKPKYTVDFVTNCKEEKASITREKGFVLTEEELAAPDKADDEFLGWYTDSALTKKFIPESQIVKDTTLYARWRNSDTVTYTVKYMCGDVAIADAKQQTVIRNSTVSEPAETVEGYYPETLSISAMITKDGQEIIFKYRAVQSWTYTVKYLLEGTKTPVPGSTVETGTTSDQNVMITFKTFEGYTLKSDPVQKVTQENQVVIFYYVPKTAIYHIQHWYERLDGTFGLRYIDTFNTAAGEYVTTEGRDITVGGFTLNTSITGTVTEGTTDIQNVLSMKLYYTRNTHQVSYQYEGDVPKGAPAAPDAANHKYQAQVAVAENPNVTGYIFSGWTAATEDGTEVATTGGKFAMPDANVILKGSFTATDQTYRVKYLDEDKKVEIYDMSDPKAAHFGDEIKGYTEKIDISGYTFVKADDLTVGINDEENIVTVYYSKDDNHDGIPDKYQITFTYVSADEDKGTVTGTTKEVVTTYEITRDSVTGEIIEAKGPTAQNPTQPSAVTPKAGYKFDKWTDNAENSFNNDAALEAAFYIEDQTFTAHFTEQDDLHYEIHYFYEDANSVIEDKGSAIVRDDGVFGEKILKTAVAKESEFNGKHYVLERIEGADKQVGLDPDKNIVNVYYSIDVIGKEDPDKPDNIPDKYQITFTYVTADADKGTVTGTTKEVVTTYEITKDSVTGEIIVGNGPTAQHPTQPSTVTPKAGYKFDKWTDSAENSFNNDAALEAASYIEDQTFTAHFTEQDDLHYEIHYFYEDANSVVTEDTASAIVSDSGVFGEKILKTAVAKESEFNGKHYVLVRIEGADKQVGLDPDENIVNVYYSIDVIGKEDPDKPDNIPDKYQITFTYVTADEDKGTVTGITREVVTTYEITRDSVTGEIIEAKGPTAQNPTQPSTVTPKDGYRFEKWQQDDLTFFNSDDELRKSEYLEDQTFIAHFTVRRDLHYEIHYFYEDANGVVTEDTAAAIVSNSGVFGEKILTTTVPKESEFNGKNYVLERIEGADKQIGLDPKENMVNVYYSMDEIGEIDPDEPDNIPDKYQVTFQYVSENPSYGTVSGKVKEVVTRPKNADGTYNMTAPVHPKAEVTVAGIGNYKFNRWSDGNTNYSAASEIAKAGFIADTTFTAYFSYSGGNSGGGSSGGGGGGSHRSTISNTSGGPGVTTTITPGDVPMAELPESPAPIVIDDGEIPMAALPKTGQTTVKAALTMMFSGIFLALTAIGRKKKEQDV
ncbi:MAG: doubled motif LPXTG anchor domain-containing protein [Clostridium sp.]|nr:doubled motif LPXTG anchor domain-containing protein [Clostridium sp.]